MKDLKMFFGIITVVLVIACLIKDKKSNVFLCTLFATFTMISLFSDLTAQFIVKFMGNEISANIQQLQTNQDQLVKVVEEIIGLIELEHKIPKPAILYGKGIEKTIKDFEIKIQEQKNKLKTVVTSNNKSP